MPSKPRNTLLDDRAEILKLLESSFIPVKKTTLAGAMGISFERVSRAIEKLISAGLVREVDASDSQSISHAKLYKINR